MSWVPFQRGKDEEKGISFPLCLSFLSLSLRVCHLPSQQQLPLFSFVVLLELFFAPQITFRKSCSEERGENLFLSGFAFIPLFVLFCFSFCLLLSLLSLSLYGFSSSRVLYPLPLRTVQFSFWVSPFCFLHVSLLRPVAWCLLIRKERQRKNLLRVLLLLCTKRGFKRWW